MNQEKWLDLVNMVEDKFQVIERTKEPTEEGPGEKDILVFEMPNGRFKLEYIYRPRVLDKKTSYSHRAGGETKVDYVYSDDEFVGKLMAFRWDKIEESWLEIAPTGFAT